MLKELTPDNDKIEMIDLIKRIKKDINNFFENKSQIQNDSRNEKQKNCRIDSWINNLWSRIRKKIKLNSNINNPAGSEN